MRLNIMVVDDDPIVAFIQKKMISKVGLRGNITVHGNGKEALDYLVQQNNSDALTMVLLDINMPVMNGWEFLEAVQSLDISDHLIVVVVSSSTLEKDRKKAFSYAQVKDYMVKPVMQSSWEKIVALPELGAFYKDVEKLQRAA